MTEKRPVSPAVTLKIGALLGNGDGRWLWMQAAYDLWHSRQEIDTSEIEPIVAGCDTHIRVRGVSQWEKVALASASDE